MKYRIIPQTLSLLILLLAVASSQIVSAQTRTKTRSTTSNSTAAPAAQKPATQNAAPAAPQTINVAPGQEYLSPLEREVMNELNMARTHPQQYAAIVDEWRKYYSGKQFTRPGRQSITTWDGLAALDECVNFLRSASPIQPLQSAKGLHLAALDHARDLSTSGITGHRGSDGSMPEQRVERFGRWMSSIGETIVYDVDTARAMVINLLIDDGVPGRGHRMNIFNPGYTTAGVAVGTQTSFGAKCVIDFVGGFTEGAGEENQNGAARTRRRPQ
ncbi:MAG TPA: CAP domain-containing protein [Pyrinomonadaceae bacterium]|nr:CAP domain-containing protein [Pyrinomonadaceae bacterium]